MTSITGSLKKMRTELSKEVQYFLRCGEEEIHLNDCLNKRVTLQFEQEIHCIHCGRKTAKSFQQGYCFPCLRRLRECNLCMIHPERCLVEKKGCPENDWAHAQCHQHHIVYLANSSALKVGITRHTQVPTRWIDQGAIQALPIIQVPNRYQSGIVETIIKQHVSDKTHWRQMLKGQVEPIALAKERDRLLALTENEIAKAAHDFTEPGMEMITAEEVHIHYPVIEYPEKITSLSLDKTPQVSGILRGIKGQYLLLDTGVMNIRKFGGYVVNVKV